MITLGHKLLGQFYFDLVLSLWGNFVDEPGGEFLLAISGDYLGQLSQATISGSHLRHPSRAAILGGHLGRHLGRLSQVTISGGHLR